MKSFRKNCRPAAACAGMTLVEMMVSIGIGTLIIAVVVELIVFTGRTFVALGNYDDMDRKGFETLDIMTRDIRQAQHMIAYVSNSTAQQLIFTNLSGVSPAGFSYNYANASGSNGTLTRVWGGQNTVLLTNINTLSFSLWTRVPTNNFTFYPTTVPANAKLISVTWQSSRSIADAAKFNTESIQTADIVVRN